MRTALLLALLALGCGPKKPPPPVIETREVDLESRRQKAETSSTQNGDSEVPQLDNESVVGEPGEDGPTPATATGGKLSTPKVELLNPGRAPRKKLMHIFGAGNGQKLFMSSNTKVTGANLPLPAMKLSGPIDTLIKEVKNNEARFELSAGPFDSKNSSSGPLGSLIDGMMGMSAPKKIVGWGWMTPQGIIREFHVTEGPEEGAPVEVGDAFPEEAIGLGARWKVRVVLHEKEGPVRQTSTYQLIRLKGKVAETKVTRVQVPMNAGADAKEKGRSSGTLHFTLGEIYPLAKMTMSRAIKLDLPGAGKTPLKFKSRMEIKKRR